MFYCIKPILGFCIIFRLSWIVLSEGVNTQSCDTGCKDCNDTQCMSVCQDGYVVYLHDGTYTCRLCPKACRTCQSDSFDNITQNCTSCIDDHYLNNIDGLGACKGNQDGTIVVLIIIVIPIGTILLCITTAICVLCRRRVISCISDM